MFAHMIIITTSPDQGRQLFQRGFTPQVEPEPRDTFPTKSLFVLLLLNDRFLAGALI